MMQWDVGALFGVVLSYFARFLHQGQIVTPLLSFYFSINVFPSLLNSVTGALIDLGLIRTDLMSPDTFHALISFILVGLVWLGFHEMKLSESVEATTNIPMTDSERTSLGASGSV